MSGWVSGQGKEGVETLQGEKRERERKGGKEKKQKTSARKSLGSLFDFAIWLYGDLIEKKIADFSRLVRSSVDCE